MAITLVHLFTKRLMSIFAHFYLDIQGTLHNTQMFIHHAVYYVSLMVNTQSCLASLPACPCGGGMGKPGNTGSLGSLTLLPPASTLPTGPYKAALYLLTFPHLPPGVWVSWPFAAFTRNCIGSRIWLVGWVRRRRPSTLAFCRAHFRFLWRCSSIHFRCYKNIIYSCSLSHWRFINIDLII